jgi:hypothetical protein
MTLKTELLNFLTGILLVFCGVLNLFYNKNFAFSMSWIIFGAMYLVMGDYIQNPGRTTFFEKLTDWSRQTFSWVGFLGSLALTAYYIQLFWL